MEEEFKEINELVIVEGRLNYFKNTNNEVYAFDDLQVHQGYGADLTAITEDEMQELTKVVITPAQNATMINAKANQLIEEKYPIYKQLNITNLLTPYTEIDRDDMKIFIENIREISNTAIENGTLLEDINWG